MSKIEWTDETWNPVVGCTRCSPGCAGCYAAVMAKRQAGMARAKRAKGQDPGRSAHYEKVENWDSIELVPEALGDPLKWRKPRRVFVCSMSDLFHRDVPDGYIQQVFKMMAETPRHTYQLLTKRPHRMKMFFVNNVNIKGMLHLRHNDWTPHPLPNVWLGVTAENQATANERIPVLLQIPAAMHFLSAEPLLGEIDIDPYLPRYDYRPTYEYYRLAYPGMTNEPVKLRDGLDLVIAGGETGPGARPMHPLWVQSLRNQCQAAGAGTNFFFKSWGNWLPATYTDYNPSEPITGVKTCWLDVRGGEGSASENYTAMLHDGAKMVHVGSKHSGRELDGRLWEQMP